MTLEDMDADAKEATPVVIALGNYKGILQNNLRFFHDPATLSALSNMDAQADIAVRCFTEVASARHNFGATGVEKFRRTIAASCAGANIPGTLDNLKVAEGEAMRTMDAERAAATDRILPARS